ncbi:MAG: ABC transporter permease [Saccharofermentanales bacterium]
MRKYLAVFRMRLISGMQYRVAAWAGVCTQFFWGFLYIMIYTAFYKSSSAEPPMPYSQLVSYIWLQQAFLAIIMLWWQDNELLSNITSGNIAYELCRPYDLFTFWISRLLAMRVSNVMLRCLPILLIAFILPKPYGISLPPDISAFLMFVLSLSLALVLVIAISMFIYILTFITLSPVGSRLIIGVAAEFLAGSVIPIPLMPKTLQNILNWFPFRYTADLPFRIFSGNIGYSEAISGMLIQLTWIAALLFAGSMAFKKIMRRVVIQGG